MVPGSVSRSWRVHRFVARSGGGGEAALRVEVLCCGAQVAVWACRTGSAASLGSGALALPGGAVSALDPGADPAGAALCSRLAARLRCPVLLLAPELDRLAAPLLEAALCSEIEAHPDLFPSIATTNAHTDKGVK